MVDRKEVIRVSSTFKFDTVKSIANSLVSRNSPGPSIFTIYVILLRMTNFFSFTQFLSFIDGTEWVYLVVGVPYVVVTIVVGNFIIDEEQGEEEIVVVG